jgi:hypothetical protein
LTSEKKWDFAEIEGLRMISDCDVFNIYANKWKEKGLKFSIPPENYCVLFL